MLRKRHFILALRLAAVLLAVWLAANLALRVVRTTELSVERGRASADVTLGELACRKELRASFPFFTLRCENVAP